MTVAVTVESLDFTATAKALKKLMGLGPTFELRDALIDAAFKDPTAFAAMFGTLPSDTTWQAFAREGRKIDAIKEYRHQYGVGLKESKDAVENWQDHNGYGQHPF